ncbi:FAD-binding domain-containing protein [Vararia minispora EC-137]|uniref:FAD-binding domain-containing protein n=1 Tax=Vararia minispora EC-137 TaxID=1314806 RepID=A0ACB8QBW4_9AGAM|nr:FAD-binding domain-containing protein [Vararia minispora EC-137]
MTTLPSPSSFKGDWVTPGHAEYEAAVARWARNLSRRASVVAYVRDAVDVVTVLAYARSNKMQIAIRCGGHNISGASSVEGGIVIDLSRYLKSVRVDAEKRLAYVGGGALWMDVDQEGMKYGLATVGGTVSHTGVGGLTLGGGIGHLMGEHGFVVDNLFQVTIVTADGSILTASESENSELFWGVRGGGSNFGIVTEFVFKMHPQRQTVFCGNLIFPGPAVAGVMAELKKWLEGEPNPKSAAGLFVTLNEDGHPIVALLLFFNGSEAEGRKYFKAFFDIGPVADMTKEIPYTDVNCINNMTFKHDINYYMKGVFASQLRPDDAVAIQKRIVEVFEKTRLTITFVFELFPPQKAMSFGKDSTSFVRWDGISTVAAAMWNVDDLTQKQEDVRQAVHEVCTIVTAANGDSASENTGYGNYSALASFYLGESKSAALFGEHYPRLQALKKKYDPEMVFNKWNAIVPA